MKTIYSSNSSNYNCQHGITCNNFSKNHRKKYFHQIRDKNNCKQDLHCVNFTKFHYNTFAHPLRDNSYEYFSTHSQKCKFGEKCKDFSTIHCEDFEHPFRERQCSLFPCRLLRDPNHLLEFTHKEQYGIISNNNFKYNRSHFFCDDIWKKIIGHIKMSCYYISCTTTYGYDGVKETHKEKLNSFTYASTISKLLGTSKMFQKILNTDLFSVDKWHEENNILIYNFKGKYEICDECYRQRKDCKCSESCSHCGTYYDRSW